MHTLYKNYVAWEFERCRAIIEKLEPPSKRILEPPWPICMGACLFALVVIMADFLSVCKGGDFYAAVRILSLEKINPRTLRDDYGSTPLHNACQSGNVQLVRILIQKYHCDPESKGFLGLTPLHEACRYECAITLSIACKWPS